MKSRSASVGHRLRRYLGALLALGFGATWWSFTPKAVASTPVAKQQHVAFTPPVSAARRVTSVPAFTNMPVHAEQLVVTVSNVVATVTTMPFATPPPAHHPVKHPPRRPKPPVVDPPVFVPETPPVVDPPVLVPETPPVVVPEPPVVEDPPVVDPQPVDEPELPPITTRSS